MYDGISYQVKQGAGDRGITAEIPICTKIRLMKVLVWPVAVATYGCDSWTLRKNDETRLDAFETAAERDFSGFVDSKENK